MITGKPLDFILENLDPWNPLIYSRNQSELPEFRINTSKLRAQIEILSDLVVPYENELIHTIVSLRNISKANCSEVTFRK